MYNVYRSLDIEPRSCTGKNLFTICVYVYYLVFTSFQRNEFLLAWRDFYAYLYNRTVAV